MSDLTRNIPMSKISLQPRHLCPIDTWQGAPGDKVTCLGCKQVWIACDAGPLDIRWVKYHE